MTSNNFNQVELFDLDGHYEWESSRFHIDLLPVDDDLNSPPPSASFIADVKANGVQFPLIAQSKNGQITWVADGRRRLLAARLCYAETGDPRYGSIEVKHCEAPRDYFVARSVALNEQRSPNALSELEAIRELQAKAPDMPVNDLAVALRMPKARVEKRLKLLALIPELIGLIRIGKLAVTTAEKLARRTESEQRAVLEAYQGDDSITRITAGMVDELSKVDEMVMVDMFEAGGVFDTPDLERPVSQPATSGNGYLTEQEVLETIQNILLAVDEAPDLTNKLHEAMCGLQDWAKRLELPF